MSLCFSITTYDYRTETHVDTERYLYVVHVPTHCSAATWRMCLALNRHIRHATLLLDCVTLEYTLISLCVKFFVRCYAK
jgi:hypothetical protein